MFYIKFNNRIAHRSVSFIESIPQKKIFLKAVKEEQ